MNQSFSAPRRQGVILLIVVIMLALFLVVGLSFMLYAESEATASRIYREAFTVNYDRADIEATTLLNYALSQLIYDVKDDIDGCDSSMRGHSLARNMYGWQDPATATSAIINQNLVINRNFNAFNGIGRLDSAIEMPAKPPAIASVADLRQLINYRYFQADGFVRDPERQNYRTNPTVPISQSTQPYLGGANVPYTFPDRNNVYLAALKANDSTTNLPRVMTSSFHRPEGTPFETPNPNPNVLTNRAPWLDTTNPGLKYMVMRPRPVDMYWNGDTDPHSFPLPASDTGDVKNLPGAAGGNDSYWMDLGYPVQTTRGGTKFKPLFAFLIVDLDGRVNLNVHGNLRGTNGGNAVHASNQGIGKWEVNLGKVLTDPTDPNEIKSVFGDPTNPTIVGRYGPNRVVGGSPPPNPPLIDPYPDFPATMLRPYLMRIDFDAADDNGTGPNSGRLTRPTSYQTQPGLTTRYDSLMEAATVRERSPFNYNVLSVNPPTGAFRLNNDDKPFDINQNLYYIIGDALNQNHQRAGMFAGGLRNNLNQARIRHMLTTLSYDLDTPGARPWVTNPTTNAYTLTDPNVHPQETAATGFPLSLAPSQVNPSANPVPGSDFLRDDGRARVLPRLDLNRKLTPYPRVWNQYDVNIIGPPPAPPTIPDAGLQTYYRAVWDRQKLAFDIYDRLLLATGADMTAAPNSPGFNARRYLAQLAVNIVDYIDDDEFVTPFRWFPDDAAGRIDPAPANQEWVFGVESPKVTLSEVYSEIRNDPADPGPSATRDYQLHFWVELFNTHKDAKAPDGTTDLNDDIATTIPGNVAPLNRGHAKLETKIMPLLAMSPQPQAAYRIQVFEQPVGPTPNLRALNNTEGDPLDPSVAPALTRKAVLTKFTTNPDPAFTPAPGVDISEIKGNDGTGQCPQGQNTGLYVIATQDIESESPITQPTNKVRIDPTIPSPTTPAEGIGYAIQAASGVPSPLPMHTVVLQRLLCPYLPYNPMPGKPGHSVAMPVNPYITVDYMTGVPTNDAAKYDPFPQTNHNNYQPLVARHSQARKQPLSGSLVISSTATHTLFRPNDPATTKYDWLVHLDRPPINAMELLHVSAFKAHEITQTFVNPIVTQGSKSWQHRAPWLQSQNRIYRALEYLTVGDRSNWSTFSSPNTTVQPSVGGRVAGKMNLNSMWDHEIFNALTDAQQTNFFTGDAPTANTDVTNSWNAIQGRRTAPLGGTAPANVPFMSFANPAQTPQPNEFPTKSGLDGTVLANGVFPGPANPQDLEPYIKNEMLTKIANSMTTRSNVFAVYLTVGFFEVIDDTTRPVRLGAEVRPRSGVPVRHKMFAIVDRTNLATAGTPLNPATNDYSPNAGPTQGGSEGPPNGQVEKSQFFVTVDQIVASGVSTNQITPEMLLSGSTGPATVSVVGGLTTPTMVYDGKPITMPATFTMYADVGENQEVLQNCQIVGGQLQIGNGGFRKTHAANFTLSFLLPSNPGPQKDIDIVGDKTGKYSGVVPQIVIIQ